MALVVIFDPPQMSEDEYYDVLRRLEDEGAGHPAGRLSHALIKHEGHFRVIEVFDTQEHLDAFGRVLMPILAEANVDPGTPQVIPAVNFIKG